MWIDNNTDNNIFEEDLKYICDFDSTLISALDGTNVLVTGSTGLIGQTFVNAMLYRHLISGNGPFIIAPVRNTEKAYRLYEKQLKLFPDRIRFIEWNADEPFNIEEDIDYIVHGASQTSSKGFIDTPVQTISTAYNGTRNALDLARGKSVKSMVFLSTMEIYGYPEKGHKVTEVESGALSPLAVRNCYPLSKQLCENLCCAFSHEYSVPVKIMRLTQTFGPGVVYNDGRVFAEFARCIMEKKDIVLKTEGETMRSYLYTADAATAILSGLLKGENAHAYNAANEQTFCSIAQMAEMAARIGNIQVRSELSDTGSMGYAGTLFMDLDTSQLQSLGWQPQTGLKDMYIRMMKCMHGGDNK